MSLDTAEREAFGEALTLARMRKLLHGGGARQIRENAGLSQGEVAAACGVTDAAVSYWESGKHIPTGQAAVRYARLLHALASTMDADA